MAPHAGCRSAAARRDVPRRAPPRSAPAGASRPGAAVDPGARRSPRRHGALHAAARRSEAWSVPRGRSTSPAWHIYTPTGIFLSRHILIARREPEHPTHGQAWAGRHLDVRTSVPYRPLVMRTAVRFPARVSLEQILDTLARDPEFKQMVTRWERIPPRRASYAEFPAWMDGRISATLRRRGILSLYSHPADALENAHRGKHTVVVTPTASGKTLCYDLPVIDAIAKDPTARALYIFPTKALAQDQLAELARLPEGGGIQLQTYTPTGAPPPPGRG